MRANRHKQQKREGLNRSLVNLQLETAYKFLENHLNNIGFIAINYDDGTKQIIQSFKKGNITYDLYAQKRFKELSGALQHHIKVNRGCTNAFFDTLTLPFKSVIDNHIQWESISKYLENYFYNLKKVIKKAHYIVTLEATEQGQVHCHLIIIVDSAIAYKIKDKKPYFRSQELFRSIQDCWEYGHSKPMPIYNTDGAIWELAKYALKGNRNLKRSMNNYKNGDVNPSDIKKMSLFYYSIKHNKRTLRTSKGILDYNSNKSECVDTIDGEVNKLNDIDKDIVALLTENEKVKKKIVSVEVLTNYHKHRMKFTKNGCFTPVDWDNTISITVNQNNEILEELKGKTTRKKGVNAF